MSNLRPLSPGAPSLAAMVATFARSVRPHRRARGDELRLRRWGAAAANHAFLSRLATYRGDAQDYRCAAIASLGKPGRFTGRGA